MKPKNYKDILASFTMAKNAINCTVISKLVSKRFCLFYLSSIWKNPKNITNEGLITSNHLCEKTNYNKNKAIHTS